MLSSFPACLITEQNMAKAVLFFGYLAVFYCHFLYIFLGEHSKITLDTKNIFIECTATDLHKVE